MIVIKDPQVISHVHVRSSPHRPLKKINNFCPIFHQAIFYAAFVGDRGLSLLQYEAIKFITTLIKFM